MLCECGCGTEMTPLDSRGRFRRYLRGHNFRIATNRGPGGTYRRGQDNPSWVGDQAGYNTLHVYVNANYPRTGVCEECGEERATEYASLTAPDYTRNREDYAELCVPCHRRLDKE